MAATALQPEINSSTMNKYIALTNALSKRGETKVSEYKGIEQWTRTYAPKRDFNGKLRLLDIFNPSYYYVSNDMTCPKLYVWVGHSHSGAGKLNTGSREYLIEEGCSNG